MIILGSKSPRRKEILEMAGIDFKVVTSDVDEDIVCSDPSEYTILTSKKKAMAITNTHPNDIIICADTIVYIDNMTLGKPHDYTEAVQMIKRIQGRSHEVITGVNIVTSNKTEAFTCKTTVTVSPMTDNEIKEYCDTNEPYDKAGAYAIQGLFSKYITKIDGDYYNVMGLPINMVYQRIKDYLFKKQ